jgi:hypothetical protein
MENDYMDVVEVITVTTFQEANEWLRKGWLLLSTGARHVDSTGFQAKTYFTLCRKDKEQ